MEHHFNHHVLILTPLGRVLDVVFNDLSVTKAKPPRLPNEMFEQIFGAVLRHLRERSIDPPQPGSAEWVRDYELFGCV